MNLYSLQEYHVHNNIRVYIPIQKKKKQLSPSKLFSLLEICPSLKTIVSYLAILLSQLFMFNKYGHNNIIVVDFVCHIHHRASIHKNNCNTTFTHIPGLHLDGGRKGGFVPP